MSTLLLLAAEDCCADLKSTRPPLPGFAAAAAVSPRASERVLYVLVHLEVAEQQPALRVVVKALQRRSTGRRQSAGTRGSREQESSVPTSS